jgi:hypothetical protein
VKETLAEAGTAVAELIEREAEAKPLEKWSRTEDTTAGRRWNRCKPLGFGSTSSRRSKLGSDIGWARHINSDWSTRIGNCCSGRKASGYCGSGVN